MSSALLLVEQGSGPCIGTPELGLIVPYLNSHIASCWCRGSDVFLSSSNPNYQESVYAMVQHTLTGDFDELNVIAAVKLMEVVLQNCRGQVSSSTPAGLV